MMSSAHEGWVGWRRTTVGRGGRRTEVNREAGDTGMKAQGS